MATEVIMPKVDMDMATGRISRWYKKDGDAVAKGEVLFEIETDKATMEIDSPAAGTLGDVSAGEGVDIPVGQAVAWIYAAGEATREKADAPKSKKAASKAPEAAADSPRSKKAALKTPEAATAWSAFAETGSGFRATPLARRLARIHGIELATVAGSGPHGRIQARDVEQVASERIDVRADTQAPAAIYRPPAQSVGAGRASTWLRREGEGIPLVLIHGFGSETAGWRPFLAAFERAMPILSIELPGHGAAVDVAASSFDDLISHVEQELAAEGVVVAHLVGHSLGGAVATAVAAGNSIEARSLFLIAPAGLGPDINTGFTEGFAAARDEAALRVWMNELVADPAALSDGFVRATARLRADGRLPAVQTQVGRRLFSHGTQRFSVRALLERLPVRTRVVVGTADRVIPVRHTAGLPGRVALHMFDGLGHMPHLEEKTSVAALLNDHVR